MTLVELALVIGAVLLVGFLWPQVFDPLTWIGIGNPFRNTDWIKRLNPPWLMPAVYVLAIMALEARTHGIVPAILGAFILGSTFVPDFFEDLLGEKWNFTTWKHMRTVGVLTMAFGFGLAVFMQPFVDLAIILGIVYYLWKLDPEFIGTVFGLFKSKKNEEKSA